MATVHLDWDKVEFRADEVDGWVSFRKAIDIDNHQELLSDNAVYVFRIGRPYSFQYGKKHSPVAYIGKGQAQKRITSHLTSWIPHLSSTISDLRVSIQFCTPKVRRLGTIDSHVEADLIKRFLDIYGELPLRNRNKPSQRGNHRYSEEELKVLHPGSGRGYHWAIRPLPSSQFFRRS